jgi:hypothetical protein
LRPSAVVTPVNLLPDRQEMAVAHYADFGEMHLDVNACYMTFLAGARLDKR